MVDEEYARALFNGISRKTLNYRVYVAEWNLEEASDITGLRECTRNGVE
ncbi:Nucleoside permease nupC [Bacillus thuringiensis YBT-1518]|uniref:Nucleoside permease nupC n=1 Tax=Bacillus thuringiensis YBT-1518 TaxID=529122 RepID=A0A9W3KAR9_BACTU|nr:Nucleoside permease nupC [Bacillus thuringiensis YBT-1518]